MLKVNTGKINTDYQDAIYAVETTAEHLETCRRQYEAAVLIHAQAKELEQKFSARLTRAIEYNTEPFLIRLLTKLKL